MATWYRGGSLAVHSRMRGASVLVRRLLGIRLAGVGLLVTAGLVFLALTADLISPYNPIFQDYSAANEPPTLRHLFGTDEMGRDVLSRVIHGSRVSLLVGLVAVGLAATVGVVLGLLTGYLGGLVDEWLMRLMDTLQSFPTLMLALAITFALGPGVTNTMIAIGAVNSPLFVRLVRGQTLSVRERDFVQAARALGTTPGRIMVLHVLPNVAAPVIVMASLSVSNAIIAEASLSFLGLGVIPPAPSWGTMLRDAYFLLEQSPWLSFFPGAAIFVTVLGLNFLGDGLRTVLDPRLRRAGE